MDGQLITLVITFALLAIGFIAGRYSAPSRRDILKSILMGADMQARRDGNLPPPSPSSVDAPSAPAFTARSASSDFTPKQPGDAPGGELPRRRVAS